MFSLHSYAKIKIILSITFYLKIYKDVFNLKLNWENDYYQIKSSMKYIYIMPQ